MMTEQQEGRRPHILICDPITEDGLAMLREHFDVTVKPRLAPDELLAEIGGYEALVVRSATQVTAAVIERGLNLKAIARAGSGLDNIDVEAAKVRGIEVFNSPDANTVAVAEHTMGLLLSLARRLPRADTSLKEGRWEKKALMGTGLVGKTLGLVGFGRIGRQVATRAQAFGLKILVNQRRPTPELKLVEGVEAVDLNDLLRRSDFVSLHVPLTPETASMIGGAQLALMKPSAYLINTARGALLDEVALLAALDAGQIAGAALDVFVQEPATDSALARHERVIATPHIAASTEDAQRAAAVSVSEQIIAFFQDVAVETILPLRVVSLDRLTPHETVDPKRVDRLARRLAADGILRDPPVVLAAEDHYVVLDGATRVAALRQLGYATVVVQVADDDGAVQLRAWNHVVAQVGVDALLAVLREVPEVTLEAVDADRTTEVIFEYGGLCSIYTVDARAFVVYAVPGVNRLDALNCLVGQYADVGQVSRSLSADVIRLAHEHADMAALVVFPEYSLSQVLQGSLRSGRAFPAGITRFLVDGRVLRLNVDLDFLRADGPLPEMNRRLHETLFQKQQQGAIRFYGESVYLLDD